LGSPYKKEKIKKIKNYQKKNQKIYISEKRTSRSLENGQSLVEKVKKYKDWNLTIYFRLIKALLVKKIQFNKDKFKIRCLRAQLDFIKGLIEFMEGLITRRLIF
jgi:hypothetical protein